MGHFGEFEFKLRDTQELAIAPCRRKVMAA
jgi:hypothetical protein